MAALLDDYYAGGATMPQMDVGMMQSAVASGASPSLSGRFAGSYGVKGSADVSGQANGAAAVWAIALIVGALWLLHLE